MRESIRNNGDLVNLAINQSELDHAGMSKAVRKGIVPNFIGSSRADDHRFSHDFNNLGAGHADFNLAGLIKSEVGASAAGDK